MKMWAKNEEKRFAFRSGKYKCPDHYNTTQLSVNEQQRNSATIIHIPHIKKTPILNFLSKKVVSLHRNSRMWRNW